MQFKSFIWLLLFVASSSVAFAQPKNGNKNPHKGKKHKFHYLDNTKTADEIRQIDNKFEKLYYIMLGEFTNAEQAARTDNPMLKTVQNGISVPIWQERTGEYWFYAGWFVKDKPEKAVSQIIYRLNKRNRDTFELICYSIPNEIENNFYPYEWQKEKPFTQLSPKILASQQSYVYTQLVVQKSENEFETLPAAEPIQRDISAQIKYFNHSAIRSPDISHSYTDFFDKNKKLIFSYPQPEGLEMVRVSKANAVFPMVQIRPAKGK